MVRSDSMSSRQSDDEPDQFCALVFQKKPRSGRVAFWLKVFAILIFVAGLCIIAVPFALQFAYSQKQEALVSRSDGDVAGWPYPKAKETLKAAEEYNKHLISSGQPVLGEITDPFNGGTTSGQTASERDAVYQSQLNQGDGIMGSIYIPKISVNLPIYHGTSQRVLASGAGHLYGSSLPVGGPSTHAVVTGHRGLVGAPMFTRLDEMEKGDTFYVKSMGKTMGYKIDRIIVIEPNDTSKLRIEVGQDRVTLMTCTPYGINTHRLLVSGHREPMPDPIPFPKDAKKDGRLIAIMTVFCAVLAFLLIRLTRSPCLIVRHAAGMPVEPTGRISRPRRPGARMDQGRQSGQQRESGEDCKSKKSRFKWDTECA